MDKFGRGRYGKNMKITNRDVRRLERTLSSIAKHGAKYAMNATLNNAAFDTRKTALAVIDRKFTLRNGWTKRSVRVNKSNTRTLKASVGSTEDYLRKQELGGTERPSGGLGVAIPTTYASGEGENSRTRKRLPRKRNNVRHVKLSNASAGRGKSRKARNAIKVRQAARGRNKVIAMKTRRGPGIFRVVGGKRRPKVKMILDLSKKSIKLKKKPWLQPATTRHRKLVPVNYMKNLSKQITMAARRNGLTDLS